MDCINGQFSTTTSSIPNRMQGQLHLCSDQEISERCSKQAILDLKSKINPVGALQELCIFLHCEYPTYEYPNINKFRSRVETTFVVICRLRHYTARGERRNKKMAKNEAAGFMYELLRCSTDHPVSCSNTYRVSREMSSDERVNNSNQLSTNIIIHGTGDAESYSSLVYSNKPHICKLKNARSVDDLRDHAVEILEKISEEEDFESTYILENRQAGTKAEVVLEMNLYPTMVYVSMGNTIDEAQETAAFTALVYLKSILNC